MVSDPIAAHSNMVDLRNAVERTLANGQTKIIFRFTEDSYLHTQTIAILVQCIDMIRQAGGTVGICNPNEDIADVLHTISLDSIATIYPSESDIGKDA
jgi:anti-anti-sigma factor